MIEPLSVEAAKDKAAQELELKDWSQLVQFAKTGENFKVFEKQFTRAMELHTASHLKSKMEEIEQALPTIDDLIFSDPVEIKGAIWMRNQIITILNK